MRAYEACEYLVNEIGPRWIGSDGEKRAGDWLERWLRGYGYRTRRLWFDCPAWDYSGCSLTIEGEQFEAGGQMFSPACDVEGGLVRIKPDGEGGFSGEVDGKIAVFEASRAGGVLSRGKLACALKSSGALAAIVVSSLPETWSTKMIRDPDAGLPVAGISKRNGVKVLRKTGFWTKLVIDARLRSGKTSDVIAEMGPRKTPVVAIGAHYDAAPYSVGARDNAAGVGVLLDLAERFAKIDLACRLRFCGFSGHEFGGNDAMPFGSKSYAQTYGDEFADVTLMLNLDGVAGKGSKPVLAVYGGEEFLSCVEELAEPMSDVTVRPATGGGSDHAVFIEAGINAIWLQSSESKKYHRLAYHSPLDDLRWVGESEISRTAEVAFEILSEFACVKDQGVR